MCFLLVWTDIQVPQRFTEDKTRGEYPNYEGEELNSLVKKLSDRLRRIFSKELSNHLEFCDMFSWAQQWKDRMFCQ
jgi:hypothetical protein